jgi:hypothetical protein
MARVKSEAASARTTCANGKSLADATLLARRTSSEMETREWCGVDPYDGLSSPVACLLRGTVARQILQQAVRRSPIDLRPLLGSAPRRMAAATGLAASAVARLADDPYWKDGLDRLARWTETAQLRTGKFKGLWSYEFDVQTRWGFYAGGSPNVVATSFAAHGCLDAGALRSIQLEQLGRSLLHQLWRNRFFAYTPTSSTLIHNANLLGAALAARLSSIEPLDAQLRRDLLNAAVSATRTTIVHQRADGSWPYGEGERLGWVDGFHTAYNLLSLDRIVALTACDAEQALERGARFYFEHLFADGVPFYYRDRPAGPSDVNNVATGLRAAVWGAQRGYASTDLPTKVLRHLHAEFWDPVGYFRASTKRGKPAHRLRYPRWGAAPALDALSCLIAWDRERNAS